MPSNLERTCTEQYGIDFTNSMREIIPFFFQISIQTETQKTMFVALLEVLFGAFQQSNTNLLVLCEFVRNRLAYTGQVLSLNTLLNDTYDPVQRRLQIQCLQNSFIEGIDLYLNGETDPTPVTLYLNSENSIAPITLFTNEEVRNPDSLFGLNFTVRVPNDIEATDAIITGLLDIYVIAPQNYNITRF